MVPHENNLKGVADNDTLFGSPNADTLAVGLARISLSVVKEIS
jgi:hypothetical protein